MRKWIVGVALALAVAGISLTWALLPVAQLETAEAAVEPVEEYAQLLPFPNQSEAYFTGTWCYISCSDGTGDAVRAFSTTSCCHECASTCGSGCVASGQGPSVICGNN